MLSMGNEEEAEEEKFKVAVLLEVGSCGLAYVAEADRFWPLADAVLVAVEEKPRASTSIDEDANPWPSANVAALI